MCAAWLPFLGLGLHAAVYSPSYRVQLVGWFLTVLVGLSALGVFVLLPLVGGY